MLTVHALAYVPSGAVVVHAPARVVRIEELPLDKTGT
jgi:hypothetical protein